MKFGRFLVVGMSQLLVITVGVYGNPFSPDPSDNPLLQTDPDGIPLTVTNPPPKPLSSEEIIALRKEQQQTTLNKDWFIRGYEKQMRAHEEKNANGQSTDLYYQLSSNKDLAKLAGLPDPDSDDPSDAKAQGDKNSQSAEANSKEALTDASTTSPNNASSRPNANGFVPLIPPFSGPEITSLPSFLPPLPASVTSSDFSDGSPSSPAPQTDSAPALSDLETPGMVSAKDDPLKDESDLTLDLLPGESMEAAKAHQENATRIELSVPMDANQLHKEQAAILSVPGAPMPKVAPTPVKAVVASPEDQPIPVNHSPPINPVHAPIANPYDILNR